MQTLSQLAILSASVLLANAHLTASNVVMDANLQAGKLIRCWEPVDLHDASAGYALSEPLYTMCSFMPHPHDLEKFYVNGVDPSSDDYTNLMKVMEVADYSDKYAVINLCLQEAFQYRPQSLPSDISMRCLCRREGCNVPKPLLQFLQFNKKVIPRL